MSRPVASIIIPTYNEQENIGYLIDTICREIFPTIEEWVCILIIVDGASSDDTARIVREKREEYPNVDLLVEEKKEGIGAAYRKGFQYAINHYKAEIIIEFDGDYQHPPSAIPELIQKIEQGYDYVLGSRRIKGGSYPREWDPDRLFLSKIGGLAVRIILLFPTKHFFFITDPTTGLKASRVKGFVNRFNFNSLYTTGFGYKLDFLFRMLKLGAKTTEIPLRFQRRKEGESKKTDQTASEIFKTSFFLRFKDEATKRFTKFAIIGTLGFLINAVLLEFFYRIHLGHFFAAFFTNTSGNKIILLLSNPSVWATAFSTEIAIICNFFLNNIWTFSQRKPPTFFKKMIGLLKFNAVSLTALGIQSMAVGIATLIFPDTLVTRQFALAGAVLFLVVPYKWLFYNKIIWPERKHD